MEWIKLKTISGLEDKVDMSEHAAKDRENI
jgi:hypothetical protein